VARISARALAGAVAATAATVLVQGASADVPIARQISVDPFTNASGQHETAVEPDSFSFGDTVVAVFQLGRIVSGGASGIGFARSADAGLTWQSGVLPGLTVHAAPPGAADRVSDPVVAYDRVHRVWLASILAIREAQGLVSSLVVSRSSDGITWSRPFLTSGEENGSFAHDKNWIACDNGTASPHAGRCYVAWTRAGRGVLAISSSDDGGTTWSPATLVDAANGSGWQPVVQPNGTLVIVYEGARTIGAVRSRDGGRTFDAPVVVDRLRTADVSGMRAPSHPSAEVDEAGVITVAWHDCRFRAGCATNDVVISSSSNGVRWSRVRRVPTAPELDALNHFVTGLAVDPSTRGRQTRVALAFYVLTPGGCATSACSVQPYFVSSTDAGRTWSATERLAPAQPLTAFPDSTGGRFVGDYISTSYATRGIAVPVFAAASAPFDGRFHQGVFATSVPPLPARTPPLVIDRPTIAPPRPRARGRVTVSARVTGASSVPRVACTLVGARVRTSLIRARASGGRAVCVWRLVSATGGVRLRGTVMVTTPEAEATRAFSLRTR
jgi:hypothetical protein